MTAKPQGFATRSHLIVERKQVIMLDFAPHRGDETPNQHPACVISVRAYNARGMAMVVPITHSHLSSAFRVEIPTARGLPFDGFAHPDRLRCLDYRIRAARVLGVMPDDLFDEIIQTIVDLVDPAAQGNPSP